MNRKDISVRLDTACLSNDLQVIHDNLVPLVPVLENDTIREYVEKIQRAIAAKGTPAYRGIVSALSSNSKSGQKYAQALINLRIKYQKAQKEDTNPQTQALMAAHAGSTATPKEPKAPREKAEPKPLNPCACGCGSEVVGDFKMGHDARVKGWLLKFVRGEGDFLTDTLRNWDKLAEKLERWGIPTVDGTLTYGSHPVADKKVAEG